MQCEGEVYRLNCVGKAHISYRPEIGCPNFLRCFLRDLQANWYDFSGVRYESSFLRSSKVGVHMPHRPT